MEEFQRFSLPFVDTSRILARTNNDKDKQKVTTSWVPKHYAKSLVVHVLLKHIIPLNGTLIVGAPDT